MDGDMPEPLEGFEPWLLRRVAQAVEAGDVPLSLVMELQRQFEATCTTLQDGSRGAAVGEIAEIASVDETAVAETLVAIEGLQSRPI